MRDFQSRINTICWPRARFNPQRCLYLAWPILSNKNNLHWFYRAISSVLSRLHAAEQATSRRRAHSLIPFALIHRTAFKTRSLGACCERVLSGYSCLRGVHPALAPKSISLWTKHQPTLHLCLVVVGRFLSWHCGQTFCPEVYMFVDLKRYRVEIENNRNKNSLGSSHCFFPTLLGVKALNLHNVINFYYRMWSNV